MLKTAVACRSRAIGKLGSFQVGDEMSDFAGISCRFHDEEVYNLRGFASDSPPNIVVKPYGY